MNKHTLAFLGHQPQISLSELKAVTSSDNILRHNSEVAVLKQQPEAPDSLGGLVKLAVVLKTIDSSDQLQDALKKHYEEIIKQQISGKITLGISVYGFKNQARSLKSLNSFSKNFFKLQKRNVRLIFNNNQSLTPTQIYHHHLYSENKFEICIWQFQDSIYIAKTIWVQDIEAYSHRDISRKKNLRAGILPPKLAQIMLNLAKISPDKILLDPFCGSGVILEEALLRGFKIMGSDISAQQISICSKNLTAWSETKNIDLQKQLLDLQTTDAINHKWSSKIDAVVSEVDLGPLLKEINTAPQLQDHKSRIEKLVKSFLSNLRPQLNNEARICLALPAWIQKNGTFLTLDIIDCLTDLRYALESCELIYHRPRQFVGRQLLIIQKDN